MKKLLASLLLGGLITHSAIASDDIKKFELTITNAHSFHVLAPIVVSTHNSHFSLFKLGKPASEGLAYQAEFGDPSMLLAELQAHSDVHSSATNGELLFPGKSTSIEIMAPKKPLFSISAMIAGTNDAFISVKNVNASKRHKTKMLHVFDAGSEEDNENCAYIPGPPCAPESGNLRATENAEGFVSISNGVHGGSDLDPMDSDWHGPVAIVSIKRIKD